MKENVVNSDDAGRRNAVFFWLITTGYMALIFILSSRQVHMPPLFPGFFDKVVHVLAYMPLSMLFYASLKKSGLRRHLFIISFLLAGFYGVTDEIHQSFVPGRDASVADVAADFIGALLGSLAACRLKLN